MVHVSAEADVADGATATARGTTSVHWGALPSSPPWADVHDTSAVVVVAIDGMPGVGKTAFAVHAARRLADGYPDGQLFLDLHGFTEGVAPVEPMSTGELNRDW
jgi:hypothetical protein